MLYSEEWKLRRDGTLIERATGRTFARVENSPGLDGKDCWLIWDLDGCLLVSAADWGTSRDDALHVLHTKIEQGKVCIPELGLTD